MFADDHQLPGHPVVNNKRGHSTAGQFGSTIQGDGSHFKSVLGQLKLSMFRDLGIRERRAEDPSSKQVTRERIRANSPVAEG